MNYAVMVIGVKNAPFAFVLSTCVTLYQHPNVSPFLDVFLPATLLVLDDHEDYHKALALNAITHIIQNMVKCTNTEKSIICNRS